jgi:hypothetical protein
MAIYTPIGETLPVNRRHGVVFSSMKQQNLVRSMAVPIQPKPPLAAAATQRFSSIAAQWGGLDPSQQAFWKSSIFRKTSGYQAFVTYQQLLATWGAAFYPLGQTPLAVLGDLPFVGGTQDSDGHNAILVFCSDLPGIPTDTYIECYWAPNYARQITIPGISDPAFKDGLPTPVYEYFGLLGPLTNGANTLFRIDQITQARLGYTPSRPVYDLVNVLVTLTFFQMQFYWIRYPPPMYPQIIYNEYAGLGPIDGGCTFGGPPV